MRKLALVVLTLAITTSWLAAPFGQTAPPKAGAAQKPAAGAGSRAASEKTIIENERAVNEAVTKGDVARFQSLVAPDSWSIDPMGGRMSTAEFLKGFDEMKKNMKLTSWDIGESKVFWVDPTVAVHTYKWTGEGTYQGQPIPSPVWASTVWARRAGKWQAIFHQESPSMPPGK